MDGTTVKRLTLIGLGLLALVSSSLAQGNEPPTVSVKLLSKSVAPGGTIKGEVTLTFSEGLHGYQNPPADQYQIPVTFKLAAGGTLGKVDYPAGIDAVVAGDSKPTKVYEGAVVIKFTVKAPKKVGKTPLTFKIGYQQCNSQSCYPPSELTVKDSITVTAPVKVKPKGKKGVGHR